MKDTSDEYIKKRGVYKRTIKEHNQNKKYYEWNNDYEWCKCKDCTEGYKYKIDMIDVDSYYPYCKVKCIYYTKDSMKQDLLKYAEKEKYEIVSFLAYMLEREEWDDDYITCKVEYKG